MGDPQGKRGDSSALSALFLAELEQGAVAGKQLRAGVPLQVLWLEMGGGLRENPGAVSPMQKV
jgi:hypothetical protein